MIVWVQGQFSVWVSGSVAQADALLSIVISARFVPPPTLLQAERGSDGWVEKKGARK